MGAKILQYLRQIQRCIFPAFEEEGGPLTPRLGHVVVVLDWLSIERFIPAPSRMGRPPYDRCALASAFVAKAVLNLATTECLIDRLKVDKALRRLCGFEPWRRLPSKATFSNAFAEIAESGLLEQIHKAIITAAYGEDLRGKIVGHVSRDSTDICARGRTKKVPQEQKGKRKNRVRGKKRRVRRQLGMNLDQMLADLPCQLDCGSKRGHSWKGYKLHLDVADCGIPLSAILTSASVHDSQVSIPLEEMTSERVVSLYSLMDSAYDAAEICEFVRRKNKVPLIEPHNRAGQTRAFDFAERARYAERSTVERAYSRLKDGLGARHVQVRGYAKVMAHLMFGILALTAEQVIRAFG